MIIDVKELFKEKGLVYLERARYITPEALSYDWSKSQYYKSNQIEFNHLTALYEEKIRTATKAPIQIEWLGDDVGYGVFAKEDLPKDTFVGEYTGIVQPAVNVDPSIKINGNYLSDFAWNYPDELPDGTKLEINALHEGNEMRFVNHSFTPNLVTDHTLVDKIFVTFFKTNCEVKKGEQLLVDYGEEYWTNGFRTLVIL